MVRNMTVEEEIIRQFEAFGMPTTGVEAASRVPLMWATSATGARPSSLCWLSRMRIMRCTRRHSGDATALPQAEEAMEKGPVSWR